MVGQKTAQSRKTDKILSTTASGFTKESGRRRLRMNKPNRSPPTNSAFNGKEARSPLVGKFKEVNKKKSLADAGNQSTAIGITVEQSVAQVNAVKHHLTEGDPRSARCKIHSLCKIIRKHSL